MLDEQNVLLEAMNQLLELSPVISNLMNRHTNASNNLDMAVDTSVVLKQAFDSLKAIKNQLEELEKSVHSMACTTMLQAKINKYSNDNGTISPNPSFYAKFPQSQKNEGFEPFMEKLIEAKDMSLIVPNYNGVVQALVNELSAGKQLPFGLTGSILSTLLKLRVTSRIK